MTPADITSFSQLLQSADVCGLVDRLGYLKPTAIQAAAIPIILRGESLVAAAPTGTGKTAAFLLPILELLDAFPQMVDTDDCILPRVLLLAPTRELALQLHNIVREYGASVEVTTMLISGGEPLQEQRQSLQVGADIIVATPGRLLEVLAQDRYWLDTLQCVILDEADRLLDLGFADDFQRIWKHLPKQHQTLLFSATYTKQVSELAEHLLPGATYIGQAQANRAANNVKQILYPVDQADKSNATITLLKQNQWRQVLIFTKTKKGADQLHALLQERNFSVDVLHGDRKAHQRRAIMNRFRSGRLPILVATDVAARGLDIEQLPAVINHDLPPVAEDYIHRIGRSGRANNKGMAISLVAAHEIDTLTKIEKLLGYRLTREDLIGHVPNHRVPDSMPRKHDKHSKSNAEKGIGAGQKNSQASSDLTSSTPKVGHSSNQHKGKIKPKNNGNALFSGRKKVTKRTID